MEKNKVYCTGCKYYGSNGSPLPTVFCNKKIGKKDTFESISTVNPDPEIQNKDNDCEYFKKSIFYKMFSFFGIV